MKKSNQINKNSKKIKVEDLKNKIIHVQNSEGEADTTATILVQNKIDYTPKVSVIIPVYNVEEYLHQCLDSVRNQTLKEIEIICVDDSSTDSSLEILKEYAAKDNRITVLTQKNLHAGVARNAGLCVAKGEYLSFLDSDDFFELDMLEKIYQNAKKNKSDLVMFNAYLFDEKLGKDTEVEWTLRSDLIGKRKIFNYRDIPEHIFNLSNCWVWNRLYRSEFIKKNGLHFQSLGCSNDTYFSCMAQVLADKISYLTNRFVHYRMNRVQKDNLTSSTYREKHPEDLLLCFVEIFKKLNMLKIYNNVKKSYLSIAVKDIYWSVHTVIKNPDSYKRFCNYFVKYHSGIFNAPTEELNIRLKQNYTYLRNILIDHGIIKEIPKRIFYVWGANEPKREEVVKCINSWKQFLPDYDIVEINDESVEYFDFQSELKSNKWFATVFKRKMWAYVADYIRIKTLYNNGGIYFDTDVSVIQNMDKFLHEPAFVGMQRSSQDGTGDWVEPAILGAQKNNPFIEKVLSFYDELIWQEPIYTMPQLFNYYLRMYDIFPFPAKEQQKIIHIPDLTIYPERYFIPYRWNTEYHPSCILPDTHTVHWWGGSWTKPEILDFLKNKHIHHFTDSNIKISIILCAYNTGKYLKECLNSVVNQTLKEIEIICVNDGSTDNTLDILKEYAEKDTRIVIINQKNQGLACARNNALQIARGRYIQFVDSDDYLREDTCEKLVQTMQKNNLDMLSFSGVNFDDATRIEKENTYWSFLYLPSDFNKDCFSHKDCISFLNRMAVSSCLTAYKRDFLWEHQLEFPAHLFYEDNVFFVKAITQAKRCGILDEKFYHRRIHSESITQNNHKYFGDYIQIRDMVLSYLKKIKIDQDVYANYQASYLRGAIAIYNQFTKKNKKKYRKQLELLICKYDIEKLNTCAPVPSYKTYLLFQLNLIKLFKLQKKSILKQLPSARIDVKNIGMSANNIEVKTMANVSAPTWFKDKTGAGKVVEFSALTNSMTIKAINAGKLIISFKGKDCCYRGQRLPLWVDYESIKIDGREILSKPISVWHDKPYSFEMPVVDGQSVRIDIYQRYHKYSRKELKKLILKLNPNSTFVKNHAKLLARFLVTKINPKKRFSYKIKKALGLTVAEKQHEEIKTLLRQNQVEITQLLLSLQQRQKYLEMENEKLKAKILKLNEK